MKRNGLIGMLMMLVGIVCLAFALGGCAGTKQAISDFNAEPLAQKAADLQQYNTVFLDGLQKAALVASIIPEPKVQAGANVALLAISAARTLNAGISAASTAKAAIDVNAAVVAANAATSTASAVAAAK